MVCSGRLAVATPLRGRSALDSATNYLQPSRPSPSHISLSRTFSFLLEWTLTSVTTVLIAKMFGSHQESASKRDSDEV